MLCWKEHKFFPLFFLPSWCFKMLSFMVFFPFKKFTFAILLGLHLLATNALRLSSSENVEITPHFWRIFLLDMKFRADNSFFLAFRKHCATYFLVSLHGFLMKNTLSFESFSSLYVRYSFSVAVFKIFSFSLLLKRFIMMCLCVAALLFRIIITIFTFEISSMKSKHITSKRH